MAAACSLSCALGGHKWCLPRPISFGSRSWSTSTRDWRTNSASYYHSVAGRVQKTAIETGGRSREFREMEEAEASVRQSVDVNGYCCKSSIEHKIAPPASARLFCRIVLWVASNWHQSGRYQFVRRPRGRVQVEGANDTCRLVYNL